MTLTFRQYESLLNWANRVRAKMSAPALERMRQGKPEEAAHCALANTINYRVAPSKRVKVDESEAYRGEDPFSPDEILAKTPEYVERFIRDFDRGKHPELVGRGWADPGGPPPKRGSSGPPSKPKRPRKGS
jgi:hypothetical protein